MALRCFLLLLCVCTVICALPADAQDATVAVASDTHFGSASPSAKVQLCIQRMNGIAGAAYPGSIGGTVATPSAAILCGDLCTGGTLFHSASDDDFRQQWSGFDYCFPADGAPDANRLHYPVYAAPGNHDYYRWLGTTTSGTSTVVAQGLMARYGSGTGGIQEGNVCYSVDIGGVHFVCLGRYADDQVLAWLEADLAVTTRGTPIVCFLHYPLDDSAWYTQAERDALAAKLVGHRVVCVLHGHSHDTHCYSWRGTTVFDDGATNEDADFGILRVTNSRTIYAQRQALSGGGDYWKWSGQFVTITGYALTGSGPIMGASISAGSDGGSTTTGVDGYYSLSVPVGWSGTVTPYKEGIVFSTPPRSYNNIQSSTAAQDYISDSVPPLAGTASSPARANAPFRVSYSGASDDYALARVDLWYRIGAGGLWTDSGLSSTGAGGGFTFAPDGDGIYYFDLVAVDSVGNRSAPASGDGDCHTIYDSTLRVFAITNRDLHGVIGEAAATYLFTAFGRVVSADLDAFTIDDGSAMPVRVLSPAHGLQIGDYVMAAGAWSPDSTHPALDASSVTKLQ